MSYRYSLLILTHNRLDDVRRCFASLASTLRREDVHCAVVDNASTDGTGMFLQDMQSDDNVRFEVWHSNVNQGVAGGRSALLRNACGDRIVFLDSDTVITDDRWLDVLDAALEPENVGVVGPGGSFVKPDWSGFTAGAPGEVDCVAGYCQMWKAELFEYGVHVPLEYDKFWTEDSDMCFQARELGYDVLCVPAPVQHFPAHSGYGQDMTLHDEHIALFRARWQGKGLAKCEDGY